MTHTHSHSQVSLAQLHYFALCLHILSPATENVVCVMLAYLVITNEIDNVHKLD